MTKQSAGRRTGRPSHINTAGDEGKLSFYIQVCEGTATDGGLGTRAKISRSRHDSRPPLKGYSYRLHRLL